MKIAFSAAKSAIAPTSLMSLCLISLSQILIASTSLAESPIPSSHFAHRTVGLQGMVVSDDSIASEWGAEILRKGGNAIDAAVATAFALAVTRPHYASLGGGGFLVYCPRPTQNGPSSCQAIDYREKAPAAASRDMYVSHGKANTALSQTGALASGVPGVPAGLLLAHKKYGTLSRKTLLSKPIELAKKGFRWTGMIENLEYNEWNNFNPAAKAVFGCKASPKSELKPCPAGTLIRQKDLANTLQSISNTGAQGFYEGAVAEKLIQGLRKSGGIMTLEDLKSFQPVLRNVIRTHFKEYEIISMPPPSSGGVILTQLLGYAERAEKAGAFQDGFGSVSAIHAISYGMSLAFSDRAHYFGDPDFTQIPLTHLLSSSYLDERWKKFDADEFESPESHGKVPSQEHQDTTHFSVIDRDGNAVALTTTINGDFGSGFVPPGTGVVMNNQMDDFSIQPGIPNLFGLVGGEANAIAPKKRPLSSMTPTLVRDSQGNTRIVIGAAGGPKIATSVFLSLLNRLQFGLPLVDAVAAARFHHQWKPNHLKYERYAFSPETKKMLQKKGYILEEVDFLGKIHALEKLPNGRTLGVPDPRGEGAAAAE
jgi:gamma-glutamyltranspeptidase/glutathione hydrolase